MHRRLRQVLAHFGLLDPDEEGVWLDAWRSIQDDFEAKFKEFPEPVFRLYSSSENGHTSSTIGYFYSVARAKAAGDFLVERYISLPEDEEAVAYTIEHDWKFGTDWYDKPSSSRWYRQFTEPTLGIHREFFIIEPIEVYR